MKWVALAVLIAASVLNIVLAGPLAIPLGIATGMVIWVGWIMPRRLASFQREMRDGNAHR